MSRKAPKAVAVAVERLEERVDENGPVEEPTPPFPKQHQQSPGLESKLDPAPRFEAAVRSIEVQACRQARRQVRAHHGR